MSRRFPRFGAGPPGGGITLGPPGPVPPTVKALIIANVAVFVVQELTSPAAFRGAFALIPTAVFRLQLWRLLSYQFLHGGVWHLGLNMLMLWMFGSELEQRWGQRFFLKYYLLCGVGGGLCYALVRFGSGIETVGASGSIFGLLMAYGLWFPNRVVLLGLIFPVRIRHVIVILVVIELLQTISANRAGIANAAHLGGMIFGYTYLRWWGSGGLGSGGLPFLRELRRRYYRWRLQRLRRRRWGDDGGGSSDDGPTYH